MGFVNADAAIQCGKERDTKNPNSKLNIRA